MRVAIYINSPNSARTVIESPTGSALAALDTEPHGFKDGAILGETPTYHEIYDQSCATGAQSKPPQTSSSPVRLRRGGRPDAIVFPFGRRFAPGSRRP